MNSNNFTVMLIAAILNTFAGLLWIFALDGIPLGILFLLVGGMFFLLAMRRRSS